jgi:DNA-binding transcriptional MerR regulator
MTESGGVEADGAEAGLEVTAVAHRLGVAPATLRTWHRRYGIGPGGHTTGRRRLYRPEDVARLELMHRALVRGVPPGEAARAALAAGLPEGARAEGVPDGDAPDGDAPDGGPPAERPGRPGRPRRPAAGGRGLALPGAGPEVRGLARAAQALDARAVRALVAESLAVTGTIRTWEELLRPVLAAVGARWARDGTGIEVEHLLSDCIARELGRVGDPAPATRPVLLACAPGEGHTLPLSALAAALRERGVGPHLLGADVPGTALAAAADRIAPAAALVWAQTAPGALALPPGPGCRWFTAGPGWSAGPVGAVHVTTLLEATDALAAAALGPAPP